MTRLPIPGSDDGDWGKILNSFLEVSLDSAGNLLPSAVSGTGAEFIANKGIPSGYASLNSSGLVPTAELGSGTASSDNFLRGDGTWMSPSVGSGNLPSQWNVDYDSGEIMTSNPSNVGIGYNVFTFQEPIESDSWNAFRVLDNESNQVAGLSTDGLLIGADDQVTFATFGPFNGVGIYNQSTGNSIGFDLTGFSYTDASDNLIFNLANDGTVTISPDDQAVALTLNGYTSGPDVPDLIDMNGPDGLLASFNSYGALTISPNGDGSINQVPLTLVASDGQAYNLQEWQDNDGNPLAWIASDGTPGGTLDSSGIVPGWVAFFDQDNEEQIFIQSDSAFTAYGTVPGSEGDQDGGMVQLFSIDTEDDTIGSVQLDSNPDFSTNESDKLRVANLQILSNSDTLQLASIFIGDYENDVNDLIVYAGGGTYVNPTFGNLTAGLYIDMGMDLIGLLVQATEGQTANLQEWWDSDNNVLAWIGSDGIPGGTLAGGGSIPAWFEYYNDNLDNEIIIESSDTFTLAFLGTMPGQDEGPLGGMAQLYTVNPEDDSQILGFAALDSYPDFSVNEFGNLRVANLQILSNPDIEAPGMATIFIGDFEHEVADFILYNGGGLFINPKFDELTAGIDLVMGVDVPGIIIEATEGQTSDLQMWQDSTGNSLAWIAADGTPGGTLAGAALPSWVTFTNEELIIQDPETAAIARLGILQGDDLVTGVLELGSQADGEDNYLIRLDSHPDFTDDDFSNSRSDYFLIVREGVSDPNTMRVEGENGDEMLLFNGGAMKILPNADDVASSGLEIDMEVDMTGLTVRAYSAQSSNLQEWQDSDGNPLGWIGPDGTPGGTIAGDAVLPEWFTLTDESVAGSNQAIITSDDDTAVAFFGTMPGSEGDASGAVIQLFTPDEEEDGPSGIGLVHLDSLPDFSVDEFNVPRIANLQIYSTPQTTQFASIFVGDFMEEFTDLILFAGGNMFLNPKSSDTETGAGLLIAMGVDLIGIAIEAISGQTANLQEWQDAEGDALAWIASDGTPGGTLSGISGLPGWATFANEELIIQDPETAAVARLGILQGDDLVTGVLELGSQADGDNTYNIRLDSHPDFSTDDFGNSRSDYFLITREGGGDPNTMHVVGENGDEMFIYNGGAMKLLPNNDDETSVGFEIAMATNMTAFEINGVFDQTDDFMRINSDTTEFGNNVLLEIDSAGQFQINPNGHPTLYVQDNAVGFFNATPVAQQDATDGSSLVSALQAYGLLDSDSSWTDGGGGGGGSATQSVVTIQGSIGLSAPSQLGYALNVSTPVDATAQSYGNYQSSWMSSVFNFGPGVVATIGNFGISNIDTRVDNYSLDVEIYVTASDDGNVIDFHGNKLAQARTLNDSVTIGVGDYSSGGGGGDLTYNSSNGQITSSSGGSYILQIQVTGSWQ